MARYGEDESPLAQAVREAGLVFDGAHFAAAFLGFTVADELSVLHAEHLDRRSRARMRRRSTMPRSMLDRNVVKRRSEDMKLKPRYNPGPLRVFRLDPHSAAAEAAEGEEGEAGRSAGGGDGVRRAEDAAGGRADAGEPGGVGCCVLGTSACGLAPLAALQSRVDGRVAGGLR